ncbi:hypothetical protein SDC9_164456 [bioreactor metagenome]|uniref:CAAX prenyl protease 2/Lysostaphin resistance protein A-like domain-containing protein n=1 Tax=bioreactor metagenome TaxID=1076179 RepID=A0A645FTN8_9ZZZZ|nr:CPBP family intramembrane glutamic endopeptidase [Candidatus Metalachnospira sp.]
MYNKRIIKTFASLIVMLAVLQIFRMAIEQSLFVFIKRTNFTDDIATMIAMFILTIGFVIITSAKGVSLSVFPQKWGLFYIIETLVLVGLLISTLIITGDTTPQTITIMIYSSIVTPVFEEIIFRGYIWNRLNAIFKKERTTFIAVTILFAIWHLGYVEGIAFRAPDGLAVIMIWKIVIGFCFGIVLGAVRLKTKNCYSTILLHGIMNIFGR